VYIQGCSFLFFPLWASKKNNCKLIHD
jgi:hypothetical protein